MKVAFIIPFGYNNCDMFNKLKSVAKYFYIFAGSGSLVLGMLGIFIPLLPTTPFLLLASYCFLRSSKKLYGWLMKHRIFGEYLYNYITYRAVNKHTKISALIFLWITLGISFYAVPILYVRIILLVVGTGVSLHLALLKTIK